MFSGLPIDIGITDFLDVKIRNIFSSSRINLEPISGFCPSLKNRFHQETCLTCFGFVLFSLPQRSHIYFLTFNCYFQVHGLKITCPV